MRTRILAAALVVGVAAGAAGAAVEAQQPKPIPTAKSPTSDIRLRVTHTKLALRVEDPNGGLPWVLRTFDADRINRKTGKRIGSHTHCWQLGRLKDGVFGWTFGDGVFRRTGPDDVLMDCTSIKRPRPTARMIGVLAISQPATPKLTGTVVYGLMPGAHEVTVSGTGAADGNAATAGGAFLRVAGPDAHPVGAARVTGGGHTYKLAPSQGFHPRGVKYPHMVAGSTRIEAPAPDPAGGPRWGIPVAATSEGGACVGQPTQVVDGRTGSAYLGAGIFFERALTSAACRPLSRHPDRQFPCAFSTSFGSGGEINDSFLQDARIARRLQTGSGVITATCRADVDRVTLRTPRDVRTLVPSPVGHAILAVYDGYFPAGKLVATIHFTNGQTHTTVWPLGIF